MAHVAFADGHVDQIVMPSKKPFSASELRKLTKFLCTGCEYSMHNGRIEEMK